MVQRKSKAGKRPKTGVVFNSEKAFKPQKKRRKQPFWNDEGGARP